MGNLKIQGGDCGGRNNTHQHEYLKSSYLKFESGEIFSPSAVSWEREVRQ